MPSRETIQRKMRHVEEFRTIPAVVKKFLEVLELPMEVGHVAILDLQLMPGEFGGLVDQHLYAVVPR